MTRDPKQKLEMVVDRLFEGRCIPFVGAGISLGARIPGEPDFRPTLDAMRVRLADEFEVRIRGRSKGRFRPLLPPEAGGTHWKGLEETPFDRIADVADWVFGKERLCDALQIERFAALEPLAAHRYIAYLAREGLINEVFSTNYDCCIEKAYDSTFYPKTNGAVCTIYDQETNRDCSGRRWSALDDPLFKLHKINGCARAYSEDRLPADAILLTERQLQGIDDSYGRRRRWVRTLLSERMHGHSLLICGFGSEEPQVRHTALTIIDEFDHDDGQRPELEPDAIADLPNAPFVAAYNQIEFTQAQILVAFHRAHLKQRSGHQVDEGLRESALCGRDAAALGCEGPDRLTADAFFERLYQAAIARRLRDELQAGGPFRHWLGRIVATALWLERLKEALTLQQAPGNPWRPLLTHERDLIEVQVEQGQPVRAPMPLWRWIWSVCYPRADLPDDWYLPLRTDARLILCLLLFWACQSTQHIRPEPRTGLGLEFDLAGDQNQPVYLVRDGVEVPTNQEPGSDKLLWLVSIPGDEVNPPSEGRWDSSGSNIRPLRIGRFYVVALTDLIAAAKRPDQLASVLLSCIARMPARRPRSTLIPVQR